MMTIQTLTPSKLISQTEALVPTRALSPLAAEPTCTRPTGRLKRAYRAASAMIRRQRQRVSRRIKRISSAITRVYCECESRLRVLMTAPESGAATAEYAIVLIAATAFAGVLLAVLKSGAVRTLLADLVKRALSVI
ncbi:hypothetical protein KIM372_16850 [Bombiscardovia nodaiensis]|uniref:DUF4244 domain-containing protein n=1 Tax=Bombiscardovia nodaiensis TaxID=2932181 RepID=A0ABN6SEU4_9BIFI|nr:hypothetical protein KIM372_16850 [Bombiscardovia nodaiensis]